MTPPPTNPLVRAARTFGHFWWDFLVGDTPELFVAMLVLVGIAFALRHDRGVAVVLLPLLAAAAVVASAWRGRTRGASRPVPEQHVRRAEVDGRGDGPGA